MRKLIGKTKRFLDKMKKVRANLNNPWWQAKHKYIEYVDSLSIDEHLILIESQHGQEMNGNVFYMLNYLSKSEKYKDYSIYLSARMGKMNAFQMVLDAYGIENVKLTALSSDEYFRILASAKYLVNDNTFLPFYMKKKGQIYLNTWHGTPLKSLGKGIKNDAHAISNAQRNFVSADYILFPNEHTRDAILKDYMVENISVGSYIMGGYPRNEAFFDTARRAQIREEQELDGKRIYAYMPTFRGTAKSGGTPKNTHYLNYYLYELDKQLTDDEILFVNLHPVAKKDVNFGEFTHIRNFPADFETYDFLNTADVLITDYSSVFFDYACSGRKIVLFTYDKEEYLNDRGMYMSMDDLPFPQASDLEQLLHHLRSGKEYDDREFLERFCKYENAQASQVLCDHVILGENTGMEVHKVPNNGKENVLLYAGNLAGNGVTASLRSLLNSIDLTKRNYYFSFFTEYVGKYKETIFTFPEQAYYYALTGEPNLTIQDMIVRKLYRKKWISAERYMKLMGKRVEQTLERNLGGARFDQLVQFTGYEEAVILSYTTFDGPKTIYVHSDMLREMETRGNQRKDVLHYAYNHFDHVAVVTEDMVDSTVEISGRRDNIHVAKNLIDYPTILSKGEAEITLDPTTKTSVDEEEIRRILSSDSERFISVGRFSPEKGHDRLVAAFAKYHQKQPDSYLFIMGGSSMNNGYQKLLDYVHELGLQEYVVLLEQVSNPYPIVKACDYFVLSSHYEGFGLVLVEADLLGLTVVSTDIPGPRGFMKKYGGTLVENSEAGILEGMEMLHNGQVSPLPVDYAQYNQEAVAEFEAIMSNTAKSMGEKIVL